MPEKQKTTVVDWLVIALSPILVMLMLGSLVYFIIDVLYAGEWTSRLCYTMFFFVIASVLIARISIEQGSQKAWMYLLGLGAATLFALSAFVEYPKSAAVLAPFINIVMMVVVAWSASKLTWDCTHLDEDRKSSGRGILAAIGLDGTKKPNDAEARAKEKQGETDEEAAKAAKEEAKKRKKDPEGVMGWFARWNRHSTTQNKKPHTPGTWIIYFSLAAVPIFGLGQSLIPADDAARRRATFQEMAIYVGSGLMLLVTTSLLSLRKYLRERNAKIPAKLTLGWVGLGAGIVVLFLVVGAVLPRPHSETPLINLPKFAKAGPDDGKGRDKKASENAQKTDDDVAGKGKGKEGQKKEASKDGKNSGKSDEKGGKAGEKGDGGGKGNDKGGKGNDNKGDAKNKDDQQNNNAKQNPQNKNEKNDQKQQGQNQKQDDKGNQAGDEKRNDAEKQAQNDGAEKSASRENFVSQAMEQIGAFFKWVTWVVVAILVVVGIFIFFLKYLEPFTAWAKNLLDWLRSLFAPKPKKVKVSSSGEEIPEEEEEVRPTLGDFPNPFENGTAKRMTLPQLIGYSFSAFDAWGWDHDLGRNPNETPNEYAARVGDVCEDLDSVGRRLAILQVRALYSDAELPAADAIKTLKEFWNEIERAAPVAAER